MVLCVDFISKYVGVQLISKIIKNFVLHPKATPIYSCLNLVQRQLTLAEFEEYFLVNEFEKSSKTLSLLIEGAARMVLFPAGSESILQ